MNFRRPLWTALGGLALGIVGAAWDRVWHLRTAGSQMSGAREVLEAHWLMFLGVAILFVALLLAARLVRGPRLVAAGTGTAFAGSLAMVVGFAWDSVRHIQGIESATAHAMIYMGLFLVIAGLPTALMSGRNRDGFSDTKSNG